MSGGPRSFGSCPPRWWDWVEFTFSHVVRDRESRRLVVEGAARLAVTDGNGKVKRLDKSTVAALQS